MSTTGIENWALDLKDVAQIYPFQGSEGILFIIGLVTWIGWHIWCAKWEPTTMMKRFNNMDHPKI